VANRSAPRRAFVLAGASLIAGLFFAMWTWQQIDLELQNPSPLLLLLITLLCLFAAAACLGWAIGWKRGARGQA
jgi:hypothetical protein